MKISVVVTTYNRPQALRLVLNALLAQRQAPFEILIADDGSADSTRYLIRQMAHQAAVPIHHLWQADDGFRAAAARNLAVAAGNALRQTLPDGEANALRQALQRWQDHHSEVVREHIAWALSSLR